MKLHQRNISPIVILLLVAILTYWQASFMIWTFKWDMLDAVFPWRYYVGECLQNGFFPFWNPYQQTGYPIHADLQCPLWYPELWIFGAITGYNIFVLHVLFVFQIFIAGFGMYKLAFYFNNRKTESLIIGISYMLCGFFVAHGQHFFALVGASYIPLVIYFYLKLLDKPDFTNLCKFTLFIYLQITGGYQALTIVTAYLLLAIFIFYIIGNFSNRERIFLIIKHQLFFGVIILFLCAPIIISVIQISEYTSRFSGGLTLMQAQNYPLTPQSFLSVLFPFSTTVKDDFFRTDISMRNIYLGLLGLIFLILSLFKKKKNIEWLFLGFGLVALLASLGNYLPIHKFLVNYIPLMNQFRMPSYFTIFFIIAALISVSIHIHDIITDLKNPNYKVLLIASATLSIILFFNLFFFHKTGSYLPELLRTGEFLNLKTSLTLFDRIFIQSIFHVALLGLFVLIVIAIKNELKLKKLVLLLVFFDLFVSTNLNSFYTCFANYSPYCLHHVISRHPKGFPIPHYEKVSETTDASMSEWPLWRNLSNFQKRISFTGFSSLAFNNYVFLIDEQPVLKDSVLSNYFVYLSDRIFPVDSITKNHNFSSKDIFLGKTDYKKLASVPFQVSKDDTIMIRKVNPNSTEFIVKNKRNTLITLLQENYKGWKLYVDGKQTDILSSNLLYMSTVLNPGEHLVVFRYSNNLILISAIISFFILSVLLIFLIYSDFRTGNRNYLFTILGLSLLVLAIFIFILRSVNGNKLDRLQKKFDNKLFQIVHSFPKDSIIIALNSDKIIDSLFPGDNNGYFRFKVQPDFDEIRKFISKQSRPVFIYASFNAYNPPEIENYIMDYYTCIEREIKLRRNKIIVYRKANDCEPCKPYLKIENGFETLSDLGNANSNNLDSTIVYSGKYSYRLDSIAIYSPGYQSSFADLAIDNPKQYTIDISVFINMTEGARPFIVFDKQSHINSAMWKGFDIRKSNNTTNQWIKVHATIDIPRGYNKKDRFKIYIWNNGKSEFNIDNMEIRFDKKP